MRERHPTGLTGELKSAAREALQLGSRYAEAGRAWLNQRTTMMNQRHDPPPQQHPHEGEGDWQPSGHGYRADQQGRHYGSMHEYYGQVPRPRGSDGHNAPRASMGTHPQSPPSRHDASRQEEWQRGDSGGDHGERGYGGGGGYSGYAGQSMAERGTHLEDPSLGIGRYGGGRQMDYGAGIDEDYPRRSAEYGRGYGAGSGYTENDAHPQQARGGDASQRSHRGRGPRHYTRSDERILEDICERLTHDDYVDASDVTVRVDSGMVTLSGEVPERWMKHRAEDMADACTGVRQVENRLRVQNSSGRSQGAYQSRSTSTGTDRIAGGSPHGETGGSPLPGGPGGSTGGTQTH